MKKVNLKRFYEFVDIINHQDFFEKVKDDSILTDIQKRALYRIRDRYEKITEKDSISNINQILTDFYKVETIKIREYHEFNIVYFVNKYDYIIKIPKGVTYRRDNSEKRYDKSFSFEEYLDCFIINSDYNYIIYLNGKPLVDIRYNEKNILRLYRNISII